MARVLCTIFIRQNKKPRLEARRRNQDPRTSYGSNRTARDQARPADHRKDGADPQRDARRFRPTRSPGPPDTIALGSGCFASIILKHLGWCCFVGLVVDSITTNHAVRPSLRRWPMMLMPNSILMRLSRYQTMWSLSMPMNSSIASSADRFDSTAAIAFVSDEIRQSGFRQQPDGLRLELRRVSRAFCHGSIISHQVRGNAEQKSGHITSFPAG